MTLLQQARVAIKQGDKAKGQRLLYKIIQQRDSRHKETAWLWLSAIVDNPERESYCLKQVLKINPKNEIARRHLSLVWMRGRAEEKESPQVQPPVKQMKKKGITAKTVATLAFAGIVLLVLISCCLCVTRPGEWRTPNTLDEPLPVITPAWAYVDIVGGTHEYVGSLGDYLVEGTVKNTGSRSLRFVKIRGTVKDQYGNEEGTHVTYADSDIIAPGGISRFTIYISAPPPVGRNMTVKMRVESARFAD